MAKRKRLTPAQPDHFNTMARAPQTKSPETKSMSGPDFAAPAPGPTPVSRVAVPVPGPISAPVPPPIAQVAGEAATRAALAEVSGVLGDARSQGRLIEALPLAAIKARHLVRDRLLQDDEDMEALVASLRARGQQTPIEVMTLAEAKAGPAYGLISGWRRLDALRSLYHETGEDRFATVKALVITPDSVQAAYVAMVEENEIRASLSLYEKARIALRATHEGVFPTPRYAVLGLFGATARAKRSKIGTFVTVGAKRSKIGTFVTVVEALEGVLMYPTAISEKLGLDLARALAADATLAKKITKRLTHESPQSAADELAILSQESTGKRAASAEKRPEKDSVSESKPVLAPVPDPAPDLTPLAPGEVVPGLRLRFDRARHPRIELSGARVNETLYHALKDWLAESQK